MKNIKFKFSYVVSLLGFLSITFVGCERELSDEAVFATFSNAPEIFSDSPVGMGSDFYFPFAGSKATAWTVDESEGYNSDASMRFDVPNANDPEGNYAGAIFRIDGAGRNLTGFNALTFWAKASRGVTIGEMGFGTDFLENKYVVIANNVNLGTNWSKYIIPIPDPSKLINERGMFSYAAGTQETDGFGYTFWVDELKFENLGTIGQPRPAMMNGQDITETSFIGTVINLSERGLTQTFQLPNGINQLVSAAPSYFNFVSSNPSVASVDELGMVRILDSGTAVITSSIAGVESQGSLTIESLGNFNEAPIPTRDPANVISVFSDAYTNVPVDYYNGFFAPYQTTQGGAPPLDLGGGQVINYTQLNFVGVGTFLNVQSLDLTGMTHLHVDINVQEAIDPDDFIRLQLINDVGGNEISGDFTITGSQLSSNSWESFDVPLSSFNGLTVRNEIGLLFFISDATISNIFVDNIYYFRE
ncbi:carbohydrate-binding protein [Aestuariivivens sediminicola]|uniref:carbohydrate-binding protein n=1 Tax=Aestuariivivens sediminicola TaxID=2913560 RepID=UPI001F585935|nr:carbohydrate-binding protein [Aestuariivivens sediminicola]